MGVSAPGSRLECGHESRPQRVRGAQRGGRDRRAGKLRLGLLLASEPGALLWGDVPESIQPLYNVNMVLAALGYFAFTPWFLRASGRPEARFFAGRCGFPAVNALYAAALFPSALWLPLTYAWADAPSAALWWAIRLDLAVVGLASLGLLAALIGDRPRGGGAFHTAAVLGLLCFCLQTAVLDAVVWPALHH